MLKKLKGNFLKEIKSHSLIYFLLATILLVAFFVRIYRLDKLLGFYFDQGRDALVIWKLWHEGKFFLIGPVTGLAGIFLGPLYYYLIAPFYLIGAGNPVAPAIFLAFLSTLAIAILYILGFRMHSRASGLTAVTISSLSYYLVLAGRWLSNPTPIFLASTILLYAMWEITSSNQKLNFWWMVIAATVGASLQFEAASGFFYIPIIFIFAVWQRKKLPNFKITLISLGLFLLMLAPPIMFNFRHENILINNFKKIFMEEKSFRLDFWEVLGERLTYFWNVFSEKIFVEMKTYTLIFSLLSALGILFSKKVIMKKILTLFLIFLGVPIVGYILFQGNFGNIYDYYMTGYYLPMILLFSIGLTEVWKRGAGKVVVIIFFLGFFTIHLPLLRNYLIAGVDGPTHISLGNELQAVTWVFEDARGLNEFNVDVYVPPVIPHSWDYLFLWQGNRRCGMSLCGLLEKRRPLVYVIYEVDPPHPERLRNWLSKYVGSTIIEKDVRFGGITIERRRRI